MKKVLPLYSSRCTRTYDRLVLHVQCHRRYFSSHACAFGRRLYTSLPLAIRVPSRIYMYYRYVIPRRRRQWLGDEIFFRLFINISAAVNMKQGEELFLDRRTIWQHKEHRRSVFCSQFRDGKRQTKHCIFKFCKVKKKASVPLCICVSAKMVRGAM